MNKFNRSKWYYLIFNYIRTSSISIFYRIFTGFANLIIKEIYSQWPTQSYRFTIIKANGNVTKEINLRISDKCKDFRGETCLNTSSSDVTILKLPTCDEIPFSIMLTIELSEQPGREINENRFVSSGEADGDAQQFFKTNWRFSSPNILSNKNTPFGV